MALAKVEFAVAQQLDERAVDVAEAEEAEVVGLNGCFSRGLKPQFI
jgi:hypothetical protein